MQTQEEILAGLRVRGFDKGFVSTPLREFKATLESITGDMLDTKWGAKQQILYNFTDMDVIESVDPYPAPIFQLSIMDSNREKSYMGVFGMSVDKVLNAGVADDAPYRGQDQLMGKRLHLKLTPGHMMWDGSKGEETPRDCWELIGVEGDTKAGSKAAKVDSTARALELLDGKSIQEWNTIVFQDPVVKVDGDLINSMLGNTFIPAMIASNRVTVDENGIHHVVKGE